MKYGRSAYNSWSQRLPNDQYRLLQSQMWVKVPFKLQKELVDFNETDYKIFIDIVSYFTMK